MNASFQIINKIAFHNQKDSHTHTRTQVLVDDDLFRWNSSWIISYTKKSKFRVQIIKKKTMLNELNDHRDG